MKMQHWFFCSLGSVLQGTCKSASGIGTAAAPGSAVLNTGCEEKTAVVVVAATSNKEACMAISVQLKDLPKALFGSCHSFLWTLAFCGLVADRGWI